MRSVLRRGQQSINELCSLVGPIVFKELADIGYARNDAGQVEIRSPKEFTIAGAWGRLNTSRSPLLFQQGVDAIRHF
jgi:hypothetical protein